MDDKKRRIDCMKDNMSECEEWVSADITADRGKWKKNTCWPKDEMIIIVTCLFFIPRSVKNLKIIYLFTLTSTQLH